MAKNGLDRLQFLLDGKEVNAPVEKSELLINATFDNNVQPSIDISELTLTNESNALVREAIDKGLSGGVGIFEGVPYEIRQINNTSSFNSFRGYLNLAEEYQVINDVKSVAQLRPSDGKQVLIDAFSALTVGYFESIGVFSNADYSNVPFVVENRRNFVEIATPLLTIYLMSKELSVAIDDTAKRIADISIQTTNVPPNPGTPAYAILLLAIEVAYQAAVLIFILNLFVDQLNQFFPPLREHKCIDLRTLLEKPLNFLGVQLKSNLPLRRYFYLPSNQEPENLNAFNFAIAPKEITSGIPRVTDFGYQMTEVIQLIQDLFNAQIVLRGNEVFIYNEDDPFWEKETTLTEPPVLTEEFQYNTEELAANFLVEFATDPKDEYTVDNFTGTNYQVITRPKTINRQRLNQIKGLEQISIPLALGSRKNELNNLEQVFLQAAQAVEAIISVFGNNTKFTDRIRARVGALKVSNEFHTVPKLLPLIGGSIPSNDRDLLSARVIYQRYYRNRSFIAQNFKRQRVLYEGVRIPFTFEDFLKAVDNSYFTTNDGRRAKFTSLQYNPDGDYAEASYWVEQVYTTNLIEDFVEP